jgi:hypothetical protein
MAINLMGLVSGFAEGASERIDDEREKEETALANRFKLAAVNKMTREKEANELKGLYAERIKNFNAAYPEAEEAEVIAAVSTESNYTNLMDAYKAGTPVDLKKHLYVNRDLIPEDFKDSLSYINKQIAPRFASADAAAAEQSRSVFGATVTPDEKTKETYASQYGASAADLERYSRDTVTVADLPAMGSLDAAALKAPKKLDARIEDLRTQLDDATEEEKGVIKARIEELVGYQKVGQDPKTLTEEANRVSVRLLRASAEEKPALEEELKTINARIRSNAEAQAQEKDRATAKGMKPLTFAETRKAVETAQVMALENTLGLDAIKQGKLVEEYKDEDTGEIRTKVRGINAKDLPEIQAIARKAALDHLKINGHIRQDGTLTDYATVILSMQGYIDPATGKLKEDPVTQKNRQDTENEANRQRKNEAPPTTEQGQKAATMDQVRAIAANLKKPVEEIKKDMIANGYVITGE